MAREWDEQNHNSNDAASRYPLFAARCRLRDVSSGVKGEQLTVL